MSMRVAALPARRTIEIGWAVPVVLAGVAACVVARNLPVVLALVVVAAVPSVGIVLGRQLPVWLAVVLGILPVVAIGLLEGLNASVFLGTTTLTQLASRPGRPWRLVVLAVIGAALPFVAFLRGPESVDPGAVYFAIGDLFGILVGRLVGRTRQLGEDLRAADARVRVAEAQEERTRLARDVHDLVAHSLTVVMLQVGGARRVLRTDPAAAEEALAQAERVGRDSLDGIREVVGLLRSDGTGSSASLDLVPLVDTYREASVPVELDDDGLAAGLPLLVRGTVYRVVQEALANASRYRAPGAVVAVRVRTDPDGITARIENARGAVPRSRAGGYGLTGLREQVEAIGGTLASGPAGGGWVVECRIPRSASVVRAPAVTR